MTNTYMNRTHLELQYVSELSFTELGTGLEQDFPMEHYKTGQK